MNKKPASAKLPVKKIKQPKQDGASASVAGSLPVPALKKLTPKEKLFVKEYIVDWNASAACRRAGFKTKRPNEYASFLLSKPNISVAVSIEMKNREERTQITADKVLTDIEAIKEDAMRLNEAGFMIDRPSALKGCELQGRNLKMWTDKVEFPGGINIGAIAIKINHVYPDSKKLTIQDRSGDMIETGARD